MSEVHEGGCLCGAVRYRVQGLPAIAQICHCRFCQRRLGTAFATIAYFDDDAVAVTGTLTPFEHRSDETGRWLRTEFCPRCGTTVTHTAEVRPGMRAIAAGTFDDPGWLKIERHIWTRSSQPWVSIPREAATFPKGAPGLPASAGAASPSPRSS